MEVAVLVTNETFMSRVEKMEPPSWEKGDDKT
jgi:hypothetical protein